MNWSQLISWVVLNKELLRTACSPQGACEQTVNKRFGPMAARISVVAAQNYSPPKARGRRRCEQVFAAIMPPELPRVRARTWIWQGPAAPFSSASGTPGGAFDFRL